MERFTTRNTRVGRRTATVYGDGSLNIPMMVMVGLALMVVDDKKFRSRTMDFEVEQAIDLHFFRKSKDKQFNTCIAQVFVVSIVKNHTLFARCGIVIPSCNHRGARLYCTFDTNQAPRCTCAKCVNPRSNFSRCARPSGKIFGNAPNH